MWKFFSFALISFYLSVASAAFDLRSQVEEYKLRYGLRDPYTKLIDNQGEGYEDIYGVRNFRVVLHGVYYRGGANNSYNRNAKRSNMNPLPAEGLSNLCKQGFTDALYLYPDNYQSAQKTTNCRTRDGADSKLNYSQVTGLTKANEHELLKRIYDHIKGVRPGPIYAHCWNGWHSSGFVAAASLRQFCKWTSADAEKYWVKNTDGNEGGMQAVRNRVKAFKPFADLQITDQERALICP
jgi:hypothetical protein